MGNTNEDTVTISKDEYAELLRERRFLNALRGSGVDNWEGYEYAIQMFQEPQGSEE